MAAFVRQVVPLRYTDSVILAEELDQKLGSKNWKCEVRIVGEPHDSQLTTC